MKTPWFHHPPWRTTIFQNTPAALRIPSVSIGRTPLGRPAASGWRPSLGGLRRRALVRRAAAAHGGLRRRLDPALAPPRRRGAGEEPRSVEKGRCGKRGQAEGDLG